MSRRAGLAAAGLTLLALVIVVGVLLLPAPPAISAPPSRSVPAMPTPSASSQPLPTPVQTAAPSLPASGEVGLDVVLPPGWIGLNADEARDDDRVAAILADDPDLEPVLTALAAQMHNDGFAYFAFDPATRRMGLLDRSARLTVNRGSADELEQVLAASVDMLRARTGTAVSFEPLPGTDAVSTEVAESVAGLEIYTTVIIGTAGEDVFSLTITGSAADREAYLSAVETLSTSFSSLD